VKDADADERRFDSLLSVLERLCEAIETSNAIQITQIESQNGDEEESGSVEPPTL